MNDIINIKRYRPEPRRYSCPDCSGKGKIRVRDNWDKLSDGFYDSGKYKECPKCSGLGFVYC